MGADHKWVRLVAQLNEKTRCGDVRWKLSKPPASVSRGDDEIVKGFFVTEYRGKRLGTYERRIPEYSDDFDKYYWRIQWILSVFSDDMAVSTDAPDVPGIYDLYQTIVSMEVGLDDFLDGVTE